jgi:FG-GAP repeat protein
VVSAPNETAGGFSKAGNAYAFFTNNGSLIASLKSPNPQAGGLFGWSVAYGSTSTGVKIAVIGAPGEISGGHADAGNAYVFNAITGVLLTTLASPNPQTGGQFGYSLELKGNTVLVGAPFESSGGESAAGNVYAFNFMKSKSSLELSSPGSAVGGHFGWSVAAFSQVIVVGAPGEGSGAGHAYLFSSKGTLTKTLSSPNSQAGGHFGWSVSVVKKLFAVSAPSETAGGQSSAGNAYVFSAATGSLVATLSSPKPQAGGEFGYSIDLEGSTVLAGAPYEDAGGFGAAGHAYNLDATSGAVIGTLSSPNAQANGHFGFSVNARGSVDSIGAPGETAGGLVDAGQAYIT